MVTQGSDGSTWLSKILSSGVLVMQESISHRVGTSLYLAVRPARTTLSEQAMHSMQSETSREMSRKFFCIGMKEFNLQQTLSFTCLHRDLFFYACTVRKTQTPFKYMQRRIGLVYPLRNCVRPQLHCSYHYYTVYRCHTKWKYIVLTSRHICMWFISLQEHGLTRLECHDIEKITDERACVPRILLTQPQENLTIHIGNILAFIDC